MLKTLKIIFFFHDFVINLIKNFKKIIIYLNLNSFFNYLNYY